MTQTPGMNALQALLAKQAARSTSSLGVKPTLANSAETQSAKPASEQESVSESPSPIPTGTPPTTVPAGAAPTPVTSPSVVGAALSPMERLKAATRLGAAETKAKEIIDSVPPKPEITLEVLAQSDGNITDGFETQRFQRDLDLLDALLVRDKYTIDDFNIDDIRKMISGVMKDLKSNPTMYDGLVLDRDVHNIMAFCFATQQRAIEANVKKGATAEKKVAKGKKVSTLKINFGGMGEM